MFDPDSHRQLSIWLRQQPSEWLADQLIGLTYRDYDLHRHLWQCYCNDPARWNAAQVIETFKLIARPGEFRDERIEDQEMSKIERFLAQLAPLAERNPLPPDFSATLEHLIEIMHPMFGDWGEGWRWNEVLIQAMRIHAHACRQDPEALARLPDWLNERRRIRPSWPMDEEWLEEAYGSLLTT